MNPVHIEDFKRLLEAERERQFNKWGKQNHSLPLWMSILGEEVGECHQEVIGFECQYPTLGGLESGQALKLKHLQQELVQVAAVCCQIFEFIQENRDDLSQEFKTENQ